MIMIKYIYDIVDCVFSEEEGGLEALGEKMGIWTFWFLNQNTSVLGQIEEHCEYSGGICLNRV